MTGSLLALNKVIIKMLRSERFLIGLFVVLFLATRLPGLGRDVVNPDGVNWHFRSQQFVVALKTQNWEKTYQYYHPGVTLMWIAGPAVEVVKQISPIPVIYTHYTFPVFHFVAKYAVVIVQLILSMITIYLLARVLQGKKSGFLKAYLVLALFSFEPFFLGNSRLLHLDVILTLFLFNGLILAYLTVQKFNWWTGAFAGVFMGLAFITKSIALGGILFALGVGGLAVWRISGFKQAFKYVLSLLLPFIVSVFLFFPALWVKPVETMSTILNEGERVGIKVGHGQIILGEYTRDAGAYFYPLVSVVKLSPLTLTGLLLFVVSVVQSKGNFRRRFSLIMFMMIFYLGYLFFMTYAAKKIDRYLIPVYPFFALMAVEGFFRFGRKKVVLLSTILTLLFIVLPAFKLYPYYFTYTNPLLGSPEKVNKVIAQKPFGVGMPELKDIIMEKYGYYPRLGFIDTKPMSSIYMASRVFDIRVNGTSDYEIIVLGPNEVFTRKIGRSKFDYKHEASMYINGLEYWRIYAKHLKEVE